MLILTSDHGESLGEHGEKTHGYFIYEAIQLFGRYTLHDAVTELPFPQRPAFQANLESFQQQLSITMKQVWSPTRLNEFRFTYFYDRSDNSTTNPHIPHMLVTGSPAGLDLFDNN